MTVCAHAITFVRVLYTGVAGPSIVTYPRLTRKLYTGAVQFNFSTSELGISEGGDLPSQLSIVKTGVQEEGTSITLRVQVTEVTPNQNGTSISLL